MNARLITYSINSTDTSKYTTKNYQTVFEFINNNWEFINSNASYYLVIGKLDVIMLNFTDTEEDKILINENQNDNINTYFQSTNNTNSIKMLIQANELTNERTNLIVRYTDSYCQNLKLNYIQLWNEFYFN